MTRLNTITKWCVASLFLVLALPLMNTAQITGPSTAQTPYLSPVYSGVSFTSIISANDSINHYKMVGVPDGLGAFDNGDGTFTLLMNHELLNTQGVTRAHGSIGSLVSKWIINKQDLSVVSGSDEIQNVYLWDNTTSSYTLYNAANPSTLTIFQRFCSADLPPVSALYNSNSGNGTQERIYMNGEEVSEGRAMAHIVTGPNAGTSWQLPWFGKIAWENSVANATEQDKTIVAGFDDASITTGNVYVYIGTKTNTGTEVDKAGLNNGTLYSIKISGYPQERISSTTINNPPAPGTHFDLVNIGSVLGITGAQEDANSLAAGATYFSRPEDGSWDPSNLSDLYFHTTDQLDQVTDGIGTQVGRSRLWHLHFTDIANPELGGTIEAVLDGTEGQNMLDNLTVDHSGHVQDLEDVGNAAHNGKIWDYNIGTDVLTMIGMHDPARFGDVNVAATSPFTQDEETSGVIDVQSLLGPGMFLLDDQAHYTTGIPASIVEGGQLLAYYNPLTSDCNNYSASVSPAAVTACAGTDVTLTANGGYGFTYQWYKETTAIPGATGSSFAATKKGNYYIVESNGVCSWTSPSTFVNRVQPPKAIATANGSTDVCNGPVTLHANRSNGDPFTYLWYQNGSSIDAATERKITVTGPGDFSVQVTNSTGCSAMSEQVSVTSSCKLNDESGAKPSALSVYPNPTSGNFMIEMNMGDHTSSVADVEITNALGQVVYHQQLSITNGMLQSEVAFDRKLAAGSYFIRVIVGSELYSSQIKYQP